MYLVRSVAGTLNRKETYYTSVSVSIGLNVRDEAEEKKDK
jgi:hypothetical protein